ncbi:MAG: PQQ-binding-like beta-propeller repeat protein [Anaerolineae bacterium]|nr:PQQ-binding-like beta-propeller repeat protein [Anaerolineae bacterium]
MAGANPQRTSWTAEEVQGSLQPEWYKVFETYIPAKVQIIAADGTLFISTANGLYALDAETGAQKWVYPTRMPLGNSPTIVNGVAYVGGLDHKLHAIDAATGVGLWILEAEAGFDTNPLVVNNRVYLGSRDGTFYAIYSNDDAAHKGTTAWTYPTGGPIHFSAATNSDYSTVYFASNDGYAYALDALTGGLVWKSAKLPSAGFHSWWPVVTDDMVILSAQRPYRFATPPLDDLSPEIDYTLGEPGLSLGFGPKQSDGSRDGTAAMNYLETEPWLRSYYLLDVATGQEITYDFNHNDQPEYAPLLSAGTHSGSRYPALIMPDGNVYTFNHYSSDQYDQGVGGWIPGTSTVLTSQAFGISAPDEPVGYSGGGNLIYWNQCCDRSAGAYDLAGNKYLFFSYNLAELIPGYNVETTGTYEANAVTVFGGWNGVYGYHGDQNPPIPYQGKVYMHRSNAVIAFSSTGGAQALPHATVVQVNEQPGPVDVNVLKQRLADEIQKMITAGHLRPGFGLGGAFSNLARSVVGDNLTDYWHNPLDTILILTRAYPYLSPVLQQQVHAYLQNEFEHYHPCDYTHIGWSTGAGREGYDLPPEVVADLSSWPPTAWSTYDFDGWTGPDWKWTPHTFYALWKYAETFGGAKELFDYCEYRMWEPPDDATLAEYPFAHNAWIAGLQGYLELRALAGYPPDSDRQNTLNRLLALRVSAFDKDNPWGPDTPVSGHQTVAVARNFIFLTPELGQYLRDHALSTMQEAFGEYTHDAPYWFVTNYEASFGEITLQHLYDYNALFAVKAMIFQEQSEELVPYLDVPGFARGDLFYIQNLILTLEASSVAPSIPDISKAVSSSIARFGEVVTYTLAIHDSSAPPTQTVSITVTDVLPSGLVYYPELCSSSWGDPPTCSSQSSMMMETVTWQGVLSSTIPVVISYTAQITSTHPAALTNEMRVDGGAWGNYTRTVTIIANPFLSYLPFVGKMMR